MEASWLKSPIDSKSDNAYKHQLDDFEYGLRQGIPIALGYVPVSFTFGLIAVSGGIPVWVAILISLTNLTSAGQFAGTNLIISGEPLLEITLTTFVINIRYLLMSLSLSQRIAPETSLAKKCIMSFGITDETFAVASLERRDISFAYMLGLIFCPYWGWALGTAMGATVSSVLPAEIQNSMGIALYAMFIALIVPSSKKSKATMIIALVAIAISSLFTWAPYLKQVSSGWSIVIATIATCFIGAVLFPREDL
jgi:4-azaleucine resistance transporter AzlC